MNQNFLDVIVVGAGISGIGAGAHFNTNCPNKSYLIFEGRENFGVLGIYSNIQESDQIQICTLLGFLSNRGTTENQ